MTRCERYRDIERLFIGDWQATPGSNHPAAPTLTPYIPSSFLHTHTHTHTHAVDSMWTAQAPRRSASSQPAWPVASALVFFVGTFRHVGADVNSGPLYGEVLGMLFFLGRMPKWGSQFSSTPMAHTVYVRSVRFVHANPNATSSSSYTRLVTVSQLSALQSHQSKHMNPLTLPTSWKFELCCCGLQREPNCNAFRPWQRLLD